jgi:hypothetical protein
MSRQRGRRPSVNTFVVVIALARVASASPAIAPSDAAVVLYGDGKPPCSSARPEAERGDVIECMIESRYGNDKDAKALAVKLFRDTGDVAGVGIDEIMDGGYRGKIHLVPELPVGGYRKHLAWIAAGMSSIDGFFAKQFTAKPPAYRWRDLALRFVRSVGKHTPSAYALIAPGDVWTIEYNVEGSLLTSEAGVRETMFHELFHTNDEAHGDWSAKNLQKDYDAIVAKCGTTVKCLTPYAPNNTMVRGGTYYAFQQNNGNAVHEYAAELAVRYWKEQSQMLAAGKLASTAFKCGPAENARAWKGIVDEFFGGRDLVPAC